jgi:hypothetical protein
LQPFELGRRWQLGQGMMAGHAHPSAHRAGQFAASFDAALAA